MLLEVIFLVLSAVVVTVVGVGLLGTKTFDGISKKFRDVLNSDNISIEKVHELYDNGVSLSGRLIRDAYSSLIQVPEKIYGNRYLSPVEKKLSALHEGAHEVIEALTAFYRGAYESKIKSGEKMDKMIEREYATIAGISGDNEKSEKFADIMAVLGVAAEGGYRAAQEAKKYLLETGRLYKYRSGEIIDGLVTYLEGGKVPKDVSDAVFGAADFADDLLNRYLLIRDGPHGASATHNMRLGPVLDGSGNYFEKAYKWVTGLVSDLYTKSAAKSGSKPPDSYFFDKYILSPLGLGGGAPAPDASKKGSSHHRG